MKINFKGFPKTDETTSNDSHTLLLVFSSRHDGIQIVRNPQNRIPDLF